MVQTKRRDSKDPIDKSVREDNRARPEVIVEFLFSNGLFSICVRNIGSRPAVRISTRFSPKFTGLGGTKKINTLPLFKNIEFLGPGREITTLLDDSSSYFQRKQPTKISARISYHDMEDKKYETTVTNDLEIYRELNYLSSNQTLES
jgi:hypothetical protein